MLVCFEREVVMSACDTLCVSVPPTETSRHAVAWREVSGFHFPCKESLGEKARVLAVAVHLQTIIERYKSPILFVPFPFTASLWQVLQPMSAFVVMRQRCLRVFTGIQVHAFGFAKNLPLSLTGERIYLQKT
jgi:hypothetical protein